MSTREQDRLTWRKSSYSNANNGDCVEVAYPVGMAAVRDSKRPTGGRLTVSPAAWASLLSRLRQGRVTAL